MSSVQRLAGLVAVCGLALACAGDKEEKGPKGKPLGPEWVKDGEEYKKKFEGMATRHTNEWKDSLTGYRFDLPQTTLRAVETDNGRFLEVGVEVKEKRGRVEFTLDRDEKGKVYRCAVSSDQIVYYDFDSDGIFDAYGDARGGKDNYKHFILVDNAFVEVAWGLGGFKYRPEDGPPPRESLDRKTKYTFADGKWKGGAN
jgi:hypothetical protein